MPKSFDEDESGFMQSLKGVRKLESDRVDLNLQKPRGKIRVEHPQTTDSSSLLSDHHSGAVAASTLDQWFQHGVQKKLHKKIRMGLMSIEATLDLHGYRQQPAIAELELFVLQALKSQLRFLLIIHGKGFRSEEQAKLRPLVQRWLQQQPHVLAFCPAQARDGGNGASYVYLKKL